MCSACYHYGFLPNSIAHSKPSVYDDVPLAERNFCKTTEERVDLRLRIQRSSNPSVATHVRAKTTKLFAGITMFAEVPNPCSGGPDAKIPPPLPATIGFTQSS